MQTLLTQRGYSYETKSPPPLPIIIEEEEEEEKKVDIIISAPIINNKKRTWKSACLIVDKEMVEYMTKLMISLIIIAFCIFKLVHDNSCEGQQAYLGLMTLVIGVWLPCPAPLKR